MIIFKTIKFKNFLSTGNIFSEIGLDEHQTTLIVGDNGAGKSTLLDALSFSLFGKPFRKIKKPQLINSITRKNLMVEVDFSINKVDYKIIRGIKPHVFEVYKNGEIINQSAAVKDYQTILERQILKVDHKTFCQVVVLGSATFQPFMQLSTQNRREIIEDLLDLQVFTTMNGLLKNKILVNNESLRKSDADRKQLNDKITLMRSHMIEMQSNNEDLISEKKEMIEDSRVKIEVNSAKYKELEEKNCTLKSNISDENKIKEKMGQLSLLKVKIETKLRGVRKDLDFYMVNDNCPVCHQDIHEDFREETIKERKSQKEEIDVGIDKLVEQYNKMDSRIKEIMVVNDKINDNNLEIHTIKNNINSTMEYVAILEKEINGLNKKIVENNDHSTMTELETHLQRIEKEHCNNEEERNILSMCTSMLKDGGIKSKIIKQYVPVINKLINKYLSSMEFMCQFELDEQFNETIKSRHRDVFSYTSFSEGEKMRINLAILFTWRAVAKMRNSINTNILIMDEVFDSSLDANGTDEFMKVIRELTMDTNTIIISHKSDQLSDKFERVLKLEKNRNFSTITEI